MSADTDHADQITSVRNNTGSARNIIGLDAYIRFL
jgi:hypothetical protein